MRSCQELWGHAPEMEAPNGTTERNHPPEPPNRTTQQNVCVSVARVCLEESERRLRVAPLVEQRGHEGQLGRRAARLGQLVRRLGGDGGPRERLAPQHLLDDPLGLWTTHAITEE